MSFRQLAAPVLSAASVALSMSAMPHAAQAQGSSSYFRAVLAATVEEPQTIAGGVLWRCQGTSCSAAQNGKRPLRVCRDLQRELGAITSFEVDGEALDEDKLARCNG
jgi:hypothetical protein